MKKLIYILSVLALLSASEKISAADPNGNTGTVELKSSKVECNGDMLDVKMTVDLSDLDVKKSKAVEVIPVLQNGSDTLTLPKLLVTGRVRHLIYERMGDAEKKEKAIHEVRRFNGEQQTADYAASVAYQPWMGKAELYLITDLCGCGWKIEPGGDRIPVDKLDFKDITDYVPALAYIAPQRQEAKDRHLSGKAFLDFPVDKIVIYPNYRNNPRELMKIQATIDSVRDNKFATITGVTIKGYASPEGGYQHNAYLAENRAKALLDYVRDLYDFKDVAFNVDSEPEDWAGLDSLVSDSNLDNKDEVLAIIRRHYDDLDSRDFDLKQLGDGSTYRFLLASYYPALRHSDYTVNYRIRNFTTDEAAELIYTQPDQLSLDEMYRVARRYEQGSEKFNEIFDIAVKVYPTDSVSNLNAANSDILRGDLQSAIRRLAFVPDAWGEKMLAQGAIALLYGSKEKALDYFNRAKEAGMKEADANLEFIEKLR